MKRGSAAVTSSKVLYSPSYTSSTLSVFMKLSALALSYGLARRPIDPLRPCLASSAR